MLIPGKAKMFFNKKHGFTLIEIMLVIIVVALLTLYSVRIINDSILNGQVKRATNQIINIEQALVGYYSLNNAQWPSTLKNITQYTAATATTPAITIMLPIKGICSPFVANSSTDCGAYAEYVGILPTTQHYYTLTLNTPSSTIALKLAAAIPHSWITNNTTVNVAVQEPVAATPRNHGWIVSAGAISFLSYLGSHTDHEDVVGNNFWTTASQVYLPNCPQGYEGHIFFSPMRYETIAYHQNWGIHVAQTTIDLNNADNPGGDITSNNLTSIISSPTNNTNQYPTDNNKKIPYGGKAYLNYFSSLQYQSSDRFGKAGYTIYTADMPDQDSNYVQHIAFYMTFCLPLNHWAINWIDQSWLQDGQCSTSWKTYLSNQGQNNPPCNSLDNKGGISYTPVGAAEAY